MRNVAGVIDMAHALLTGEPPSEDQQISQKLVFDAFRRLGELRAGIERKRCVADEMPVSINSDTGNKYLDHKEVTVSAHINAETGEPYTVVRACRGINHDSSGRHLGEVLHHTL